MTTRPRPLLHRDEEPHFAAAARGELRLPYCPHCERFFWPAGPVCPRCLAADVEWRACSGRGRISSWVRFHKRYFDGDQPPYDVVQVELAEGPRLTTSFASGDPLIGEEVEVTFRPIGDGLVLPEFARRSTG